MTTTRLTCAQTPLSWPSAIAITDLPVCTGCAIRLDSPQPGSLQVTTRRAGDGVGDGVNVDENRGSVAVDYRGQRYTLMEAIFHSPGQHVFPGQSDVYPAEYCLHLQTFAAPQRQLTLVVPVSHQVTGPGVEYFAAIKAQPDPAVARPTLLSLFASPTIDTIQFLAPDLRGRTAANPTTDACTPGAMENMMALVLQPCQIRAADLERIPREGSLSSDPRDLPAQPRLKPTEAVSRATLQSIAVLARPGLQTSSTPTGSGTGTGTGTGTPNELECYPLQVQDGRDVIVTDGSGIPIETVLGLGAPQDVSGQPTVFGTLRTAVLGPIPKNQEEADAQLQRVASIAGFMTAFLFSITIWLFLHRLLFKESTTPVLSTLSLTGMLCILVAAFLGMNAL